MGLRGKLKKANIDNRHVSVDALNWALQHVTRHGDTDIFPVPFEYQALSDRWSDLVKTLTQPSIRKLQSRAYRTCLVPKTHGGFRIAHQLDPLDTLIYTALVFEMGYKIERARQPKDVACAYRFQPKENGDFFPRDNGWGTFTRRSRELARENQFVLHMDIADFYNQIYHHRLAGALETAGMSTERSENVEAYLGNFTAWQSQGIPVGPSASNLLAECCLDDIDSSLRALDVPFVRYIDDFRVFAPTERSLIRVLQETTKRLYTNHRLALQSGKTRIEATDTFVRHNLNDPQQLFEGEMEDRLEGLVEQLNEDSGYEITVDELSPEQWADELEECLDSLFVESLKATPTRLGTIRFVLREAARFGSENVPVLVAAHFSEITPIIGEVLRYLKRIVPDMAAEDGKAVGKVLLKAAHQSSYADSDFLAKCIVDLLTTFPNLTSFGKAMAFARGKAGILGFRSQALLARAYGKTFWVREHKDALMELGPWDRRGLIWAASVLPQSERAHWLGKVRRRLEDPLEVALAEQVAET